MGQNKFRVKFIKWDRINFGALVNKQTNMFKKRSSLFIKKSLKLNKRILSNGKKMAAYQEFRMSF